MIRAQTRFSLVRLIGHKLETESERTGSFTIHIATINGHSNVVSELLKHKDINVNLKNGHGYTTLHMATGKKNDQLVEAFIEHKRIDVNALNVFGQTPLDIAALNGHSNVVKVLLEHDKILIGGAFTYAIMTNKI